MQSRRMEPIVFSSLAEPTVLKNLPLKKKKTTLSTILSNYIDHGVGDTT